MSKLQQLHTDDLEKLRQQAKANLDFLTLAFCIAAISLATETFITFCHVYLFCFIIKHILLAWAGVKP